MKSNLLVIAKKMLEFIEAGDDFVVTQYKSGRLIKIPVPKEDVEPHVCDFLQAGLDKELVAYYFAYVVCTPGNEVYTTKSQKYFVTDTLPNLQDKKVYNGIVEEFWAKANECKNNRIKAEQMAEKM